MRATISGTVAIRRTRSYTIVSGIASAGFNWKVGGGVGFGALYAWERNETEGLPVVEGGRVTATLTYGVDWK